MFCASRGSSLPSTRPKGSSDAEGLEGQRDDAFYVPPGHVPLADADSEYVSFSPADELARTSEVMQRNMEPMQEA
jgi:uncharacterized membrane protein YdfJ with MMPL/SSD domain